MKYLAVSLLLILNCGGTPARPVATNQYTSTLSPGSKARLELRTTIVKSVACSPELFGLSLRLSFRNNGSEPVIIDKQSFWIRSLVSVSTQAAAAKKYIHWNRGDMWGPLPYGLGE